MVVHILHRKMNQHVCNVSAQEIEIIELGTQGMESVIHVVGRIVCMQKFDRVCIRFMVECLKFAEKYI